MRVTIKVDDGPGDDELELTVYDLIHSLSDNPNRKLHQLLDDAVWRVKKAYPVPANE